MTYAESYAKRIESLPIGTTVTIEKHDRWGNVNHRSLATIVAIYPIAQSVTVQYFKGRRRAVGYNEIRIHDEPTTPAPVAG